MPFEHPDAVALRDEHVAYGNQLYASDPSSVHRSGSEGIEPSSVVATVVAYDDEGPVGHACLRELDGELEIKRMYVVPSRRGSRHRGRAARPRWRTRRATRVRAASSSTPATGSSPR